MLFRTRKPAAISNSFFVSGPISQPELWSYKKSRFGSSFSISNPILPPKAARLLPANLALAKDSRDFLIRLADERVKSLIEIVQRQAHVFLEGR